MKNILKQILINKLKSYILYIFINVIRSKYKNSRIHQRDTDMFPRNKKSQKIFTVI